MNEVNHDYSDLEKQLINNYQQGLPLTTTPYHDIALQLGVSVQAVLDGFKCLQQQGVISRIGPVFRANRIGVSTLVAMAVRAEDLQMVADIVSGYEEVNHNYQREHEFNLWFVATAANQQHLDKVLGDIEQRTRYAVMRLPMLEDYYIDLGFNISWQ